MVKPPAEFAPTFTDVTDYDHEHANIYRHILESVDDRTDWRAAAKLILGIDPSENPKRARHSYDSHLARARWLTEHGHIRWLKEGRTAH